MGKAESYVAQGSGPENTVIRTKLQTRTREIHGCSCQVTFLCLQINILFFSSNSVGVQLVDKIVHV